MPALSESLKTLAARDELEFRDAKPRAGLTRRVARRRAARAVARTGVTLTTIVAASATAYASSQSPAREPLATLPAPFDVGAPPAAPGYERVVVPLDDEARSFIWSARASAAVTSSDPYFECDRPTPSADPASGRAHIRVTGVAPLAASNPWLDADGSFTWLYALGGSVSVDAAISPPIDGEAFFTTAALILSRDGTQIGQGAIPIAFRGDGYLSGLPCDSPRTGALVDAADRPRTDLADFAGSYAVTAVAHAGWAPETRAVAQASTQGWDSAWFGADWAAALPCADEISAAHAAQDRSVIECLPHLYVHDIPTVGAFAVLDFAPGALGGERIDEWIVSEPYYFTIAPDGTVTQGR